MNESVHDEKTNPHFTQSRIEEKDRLLGNGHEYICTNKMLGRGNFSHVYDGYMCVYTPVAIKKIHMNATDKEKNQKYLKSEIHIMKGLKHENIVNLLDVIWKDGQLNIILEQCGGGDLKKYLDGKAMREEYVQFYAKQLSHGLEYLYNNSIVHRDLKPQNLLLNTDHTILKISDFGFAKIIGADTLAQTICGTPMYMAPEIMNVEPYTDKADLWSVGIILFEMFFARYPFHGMKNQYELMKLMKTDIKIEIPAKPLISNEAKSLIKGLLVKDPQKRMKWNDFFAHVWFKSHFTKTKKSSGPADPSVGGGAGGAKGSVSIKQPKGLDFNYVSSKDPIKNERTKPPSKNTPLLRLTETDDSVVAKVPIDDVNVNPFEDDSEFFSMNETKTFKFDEEETQNQKVSQTSKPIPITPSYPINEPLHQKKKPMASYSVPSNIGCDRLWGKTDSSSPMTLRDSTFSPQTDVSLHINSTSPFVKSYNVKLNIVDDYSSTDIVPADTNFKYSSVPADMNRRDILTERNAFSMINMRGRRITEDDEEEKTINGGNVSKIFKDYAVASYHLVKDSLKF